MQFGTDEVERRPVVRRVAGREAASDERGVCGSATQLAVVVRAKASRKEAEAVSEAVERSAERVGDAALEPAVGPGAHTSEHRAALPRLAQRGVDAVQTPDRERVRRVSTRHDDDVLRREVAHRLARDPEEAETAWLAVARRERFEEGRDGPIGVACRGRHEADARAGSARQREHEVVQR